MSIWTIQETENCIFFIEQENSYQSYDILNLISIDNYNNSPIQIPNIACFNGYEDSLVWGKNQNK